MTYIICVCWFRQNGDPLHSGLCQLLDNKCRLTVIIIVISRSQKRYSKAKLIHERCDESIGSFPKGVKRSSGPISRIPGGDRVAVKVGVVQVEKVNDQMGQSRSV